VSYLNCDLANPPRCGPDFADYCVTTQKPSSADLCAELQDVLPELYPYLYRAFGWPEAKSDPSYNDRDVEIYAIMIAIDLREKLRPGDPDWVIPPKEHWVAGCADYCQVIADILGDSEHCAPAVYLLTQHCMEHVGDDKIEHLIEEGFGQGGAEDWIMLWCGLEGEFLNADQSGCVLYDYYAPSQGELVQIILHRASNCFGCDDLIRCIFDTYLQASHRERAFIGLASSNWFNGWNMLGEMMNKYSIPIEIDDYVLLASEKKGHTSYFISREMCKIGIWTSCLRYQGRGSTSVNAPSCWITTTLIPETHFGEYDIYRVDDAYLYTRSMLLSGDNTEFVLGEFHDGKVRLRELHGSSEICQSDWETDERDERDPIEETIAVSRLGSEHEYHISVPFWMEDYFAYRAQTSRKKSARSAM